MDMENVISWVEGLAEDDWRLFHSDSEVQNIAKAVLALLKEQEETIRNLEQEIRDKNERLKERAEQVDSMLKEKETVEPICIKKDFVDEFYGYVASCPKCKTLWIMYQDEKMHYCPNCGRSVKWE